MGSTVEHRPRKSTFSKIGKIFNIGHQQDNEEAAEDYFHQDKDIRKFSNPSSINSSSSSLVEKSPMKPPPTPQSPHQNSSSSTTTSQSRSSSRPPSNAPSRSSSVKRNNNNKSPVIPPVNEKKVPRIVSNVHLSRSSSVVSNHPPSSASIPNGGNLPLRGGRFILYEDESHEHHLKNAKRQEKLSNMLKNLLVSQKLRDEAKSAVPEILSNNPPTLFSGLVKQMNDLNNTEKDPFSGATKIPGVSIYGGQSSTDLTKTFAQRYGRCQEVVGRGTFGVVRVSHKKESDDTEKLFAVKEFKKKPSESESKYSRRLTSEFCISSSLKHVNIIETLDLLQDAKGDYVEVMEYCSGGDLYTLIIAAGKLEYLEADCFFKQLIRGVVYMHNMGVAHRDLKPENLLLTANGTLKITDFGNGECFKMAWENEVHFSEGICGSSPYIAPEEYTSEEFDPRSVDIWACGVIYMAMRTGRHLWRVANSDDEFYRKYLEGRKSASGYEPIEMLKRARCRNVIYSILDPVPARRINGKQILNSEWGREIKSCTAA
ncbi:hypothetical protein WICMUC_004944 [Wickerhamomyces mucosus]|uniref:non-specific serine/threonine protein kinase n=1 Tax=Wickerhamomyces mucosus TaxID=1378264 RepID=A0A9P8PDY1_9ASCO|nr:hypothetical protein WICMUC_004944 [Wickerhamomyces mucosus]